MYTDAEKQLHARIREVYVNERRKFEKRVTGASSSYGLGHMPKWDGTDDVRAGSTRRGFQDKYGKSYKPIWPKIAEFALKEGVDPLKLIQTRFTQVKGPRPPEPTDCMSKAALELCQTESISVDELDRNLYEVEGIFKTQVENRSVYILKHGWTAEQVICSVVKDLTLPFNPLYRYYLARINGIDDVANQHRPVAVLEYLRHMKPYDSSLWVNLIPPEIIEEARLAAV